MNAIPNMIQQGSFGTTQPMMSGGGYNPYSIQPNMSYPPTNPYQQPMSYGNMIPVGTYNYNSTAFSYNNTQPSNNGYVFQPVVNNIGYAPNPYAYNQPRQDYYNPFPQYNRPQASGLFTQIYGQRQQQPYSNYSPFMSMQRRQAMVDQQMQIIQLKYKIIATITNTSYDPEAVDRMYNPYNDANVKTPEQIDSDRAWAEVQKFTYFSQHPSQADYPERNMANYIQAKVRNLHEALDNHSLCEFVEMDLPKLSREIWIAENIKKNSTRDLSRVYNSKEYNELLSMHASSNPYLKEILDTSRFDNNIDDMELGLAQIFDQERRRISILEKPLPTYISSLEVQKQRHAFTEALLQQAFNKKGQVPEDVPF